MNRRVQASLVSLMLAALSGAVFAQSGVNVPLQPSALGRSDPLVLAKSDRLLKHDA